MVVKKGENRQAAAFIFDLDGTLVDSGLDIAHSANHVRSFFGLAPLGVDVVRHYVGDGVAMLLRRALGHDLAENAAEPGLLSAADGRLPDALAIFAEHYGAHLLDNTRPYPGVPDVLRHLRGYPLMLATNKPRAFTDRILAGLGMSETFRRIVAGDEAPTRKPDPAHLRACLVGLALDPAEVVVVGDSPNDVLAAQALGAVSVGCTYGLVAPESVRALRPDHIIHAPRELCALFPAFAS